VLERELTVAVAIGGKFVQVRRRPGHTDGQRAEIMQRGDLHLPRLHGFQDARHEADADAVAQFRVFKTQFTDFAQHRATVGMAGGIPASGERIHVVTVTALQSYRVTELKRYTRSVAETSASCRRFKQNTGRIQRIRPAVKMQNTDRSATGHQRLIVSVACGKHGGETGDLFLPAADGRGFLELPTHTDDFERAFAVDFFLKPAQRTFHRFTFFQFDLCQCTHFLSGGGQKRPFGRSRKIRNAEDRFFGG
jgi:hypothetical protein